MFDLTTRPFETQILEAEEQRLCNEILEPPKPSEPDIDDRDRIIPECPNPNITVPVRCSES